MSKTLSFRDPYTTVHQEKVAELACLIGDRIGLDKERLDWLYSGALLHDIGNMSVPGTILSKPGKLTEEEWGVIRSHVKRGSEILKDMDLPSQVIDMVPITMNAWMAPVILMISVVVA